MPKLYSAQQIHKIPVLAVSGMTKSSLFCLLALITINISLNAAAHAEVAPNALPSQGQVVAGQASITQQDAAMTIHQTSDKAIIDWQSFSIGKDAQLNFQQPDAHAAALNRVIADNASEIYGHLNANGHVYFVNPKGVLFAPGSHVDVGGLVASTQNISNEDFLAGKNQFQRNGAQGSIVNQGEIIAHNGGTVALLSPNVSNQGIIVAQQGDVVLAGGDKVTLQAGANGHLQIAIDPATVDSLIENKQLIKADGGQVIMTTAAASSLWSNVVSNTGTLEAKEMAGQAGQVILSADSQHGEVQIGGLIDVSGQTVAGHVIATGHTVIHSGEIRANSAEAVAGQVKILGTDIQLQDNSQILADGTTGGGVVQIGAPKDNLANEVQADTISLSDNALISANATDNGDGGRISLIANLNNPHSETRVNGTIRAWGGGLGGNGGFIETSAAILGVGNRSRINTSSARGRQGTWLLDPLDFTIAASGGNITGTALSTALASNDVTIETNATTSSCTNASCTSGTNGNGDIFVNDSISWSSDKALTLSAYRNVTVSAPIALSGSSGAALNLYANALSAASYNSAGSGSGGIAINAPVTVSGAAATVTLKASAISGVSFSGLTFGAGGKINYPDVASVTTGRLTINGQAYSLLSSLAQLDALDGDIATNTTIGTLNDVSGNYALSQDIDASGVNYHRSLIDPTSSKKFSGLFDGLGHTISNLTINTAPNGGYAGLFGYVTGTVANIGILNAALSTIGVLGSYHGAIVAYMGTGSKLTGSYATGTMTIDSGSAVNIGGLVGLSLGSIQNCWANVYITAPYTAGNIGGLVGSITTNAASIINSFAIGSVINTSSNYAGGLVGRVNSIGSSIRNSYATGFVSSVDATKMTGLASSVNGSTISNAYWNTQSSGTNSGVGIGLSTAQLQSSATGSDASSNITSASLGDSSGTVWGISSGQYPYLKYLFPNGMQTVSGIAYKADGTAASSTAIGGAVNVNLTLDGVVQPSVATGANGYYYFALPITLANNASLNYPIISEATKVLAWTNANSSYSNNSFNIANNAGITNNISGFNLNPSWTANAGANTLLSDISLLIPEFNTYTSTPNFIKNGDYELSINANGAFNVDRSFTRSAKLKIVSGGNLTLNNVISVSAGDITLSGSNFLNSQGSSALIVNNPYRWLVYSSTAANNNFGGLVSGNSAIWNTAYNAITPSNVASSTGNRYIFSGSGGTVTIHTHAANKTYGSDPLSQTDLNNTLSYGFTGDIFNSYGGVYTAILPSIAASFTTAPSVTSSGNLITANAGDYGYILNTGTTIPELSVITDNTHLFTVNKAQATITANDQTKSYGRIPYSGGNGVSSIGFVNAETLENLLGILSYGGNSQGAINTGFYVIKPQGLYSNNYNIDFKDGKLTILPDHVVNSIFRSTCIYMQNASMKAASMCG